MEKNYTLENPKDFIQAAEHKDVLVSNKKDAETTESIQQWFEDNGFLLPVFYVVRLIDGKTVKAVIDGWKKVLYARNKGIESIPAVELHAEGDELISIMVQLQRSGHNGLMALYHMAKALYPKHYRGQGHRTDLTERELDVPTVGKDGRKLNIYERIGRDLGIKSGNKVKYILKVGEKGPFHFERIENSRFTLYQAFIECKKEEEEYEPDVPKIKEPIYHTNMTATPEFNTQDNLDSSHPEYTSTSTAEFDCDNDKPQQVTAGFTLLSNDKNAHIEEDDTASYANESGGHPELVPPTDAEITTERLITVSGMCKCCGKETEITINLNKYL